MKTLIMTTLDFIEIWFTFLFYLNLFKNWVLFKVERIDIFTTY